MTLLDCLYIFVAGVAGVWEAWCFDYGRDSILTVALVLLMGFPFAAASYAHDRLSRRAGAMAGGAPRWRRTFLLWVGMPLSFACGALAAGGLTALIYAIANPTSFPGYLPFSVLVTVACFAWTCCIRVWMMRSGSSLLGWGFLCAFLALVAGALLGFGLSALIVRSFHKDVTWLAEGVIVTATSAAIISTPPQWFRLPNPLSRQVR